jgi:hypothetical protein
MHQSNKKTLIEQLAGNRYQVGWDEAAEHTPGGKTNPYLRDQYHLIPCKFGDIYKHAEGILAWCCMNSRVVARAIKEAPPWLELYLDCDGEAIFTFPVERFEEVAKWAKPKRKPGPKTLSDTERGRLRDIGKGTRFGAS